MTGGHRHSQYCLKFSGIPGNDWFPQLSVTYTCITNVQLGHYVTFQTLNRRLYLILPSAYTRL